MYVFSLLLLTVN